MDAVGCWKSTLIKSGLCIILILALNSNIKKPTVLNQPSPRWARSSGPKNNQSMGLKHTAEEELPLLYVSPEGHKVRRTLINQHGIQTLLRYLSMVHAEKI